jgi:hypothetical protein
MKKIHVQTFYRRRKLGNKYTYRLSTSPVNREIKHIKTFFFCLIDKKLRWLTLQIMKMLAAIHFASQNINKVVLQQSNSLGISIR